MNTEQQPTSLVAPIRLGLDDARAERRAREQDEFHASLGEGGGEGGE